MRADYHTHTTLCGHAAGAPAAYLDAALKAGLTEYGISDHVPYPVGMDVNGRMFPEQWVDYLKIVDDLRILADDRIQIRLGVEIDWVPGKMDETYALIRDTPFDYVIGSVHFIDGFAFDHPDSVPLWQEEGSADRIWSRYLSELSAMAKSGCADIIGHLDLPKKFGFYPSPRVMQTIRDGMAMVFESAAARGMAIDLNTSGWRKPINACYPDAEFLKMAAAAGLGLTLGSDAHDPSEIAYRFDDAVAFAQHCGFKELTLFNHRNQIRVPLK